MAPGPVTDVLHNLDMLSLYDAAVALWPAVAWIMVSYALVITACVFMEKLK